MRAETFTGGAPEIPPLPSKAVKGLVRFLTARTPAAFCARLALAWSPLVAFVVLHPLRLAIEEPLTRLYAVVTSAALDGLGVAHARQGAMLVSRTSNVAVEIAPVCTGYFLFWLYLGAVLAFPSTWRQKLVGALVGAALIFVLNVVRILSLYWVLGAHPELFDELHLVVWQSVTILTIVLAWYVWASRGSAASAPAA